MISFPKMLYRRRQAISDRLAVAAIPFHSPAEELANTITHGIGAAIAAVGVTVLLFLATRHADATRIAAFSIYGATLLLVYISSTAYHAVSRPRLKNFFRALDHAGIYFFIAGTYTPFMLVLGGQLGWTIVTTLWCAALIGTFFKCIFLDRFEILCTIVYLVMAWGAFFFARPLVTQVPFPCMEWVAAGAIAYTVGVVFFLWSKLPFNHAIWHLFVIAGSACHFMAIFLYLLPA
jgi:hemolysin III